ncbi:glutathione binding-like protein [Rhizobium sp.]
MKLYYESGTSALASHIALIEAGFSPELVKVDIPTHRTAAGDDYYQVNPKGCLPSIICKNGENLTESVAILDWAAQQTEDLKPKSEDERMRLIEMLAFVSTEIQKPLIFTFFIPGDEAIGVIRSMVAGRFAMLGAIIGDTYILGDRYSTADALLYVTLRWAGMLGMDVPANMAAYMERIEARPAVQQALRDEGLA